jgi:glycerophosphoryl diester phosphodiesterase/predicted amidohydrolase
MKICLIQPPYAKSRERGDDCFRRELAMLRGIDDADCIVLPEYSDVLWAAPDRETVIAEHEKNAPVLFEECREAAVRCGAVVFCNTLDFADSPLGRNTTWMLDPAGAVVGKYAKRHLPPLERDTLGLDPSVTETCEPPVILPYGGVRYAFLTCYDFYFYEAFPMIARARPDIIVGCSLQRSDRHAASEILSCHLAYNTNAYVVRASVSYAEDATVCGASMIVAPDGKVLANMRGAFGRASATFDPAAKYLKPAGFGNPPAPHYEYIEFGRHPWQYRNGGAAMIRDDATLPYPRICAHRGFNTIAPENSMPAFGAAVAMGAEEIEFDLWPTADGEIVSCHDATLDRVSDGTGKVYEHTLAELRTLDFGAKFDERFRGLGVVLFEDILRKFAGQVVMNVHVKTLSDDYDQGAIDRIVALLRQYDCARHAYFMISHDAVARRFQAAAPEVGLCVGHLGSRPWEIVERAIELGARKVQLFKPYFNQEMINKAHQNGILCNVFWSDDPQEALKFLDMGIDCILTNDYWNISNILRG